MKQSKSIILPILFFLLLSNWQNPLFGLSGKDISTADSGRFLNRRNDTAFSEENWKKVLGEMNFNEEEEKKENQVDTTEQKKSKWNLNFSGYKFNRQWFWVVLLIILFLATLTFVLRTKWNRRNAQKTVMVNPDEIDAHNIDEQNFESMIKAALNQRNFNLAFRYRYLEVLRALSSRNLIFYKKEKTNFQYLMELGDTRFYEAFKEITGEFDLVWYGEIPLTEGKWIEMDQVCKGIIQSIGNQ